MSDDELVEFTVQSNVYVVDSMSVPKSATAFGWGSVTEAVECSQCYALVPKRREFGHSLWHKESDG